MNEIKRELPMISFCMPNYNDSATIGEAIESIFDQDYPEIEMIICDDGSTDKSLKVLNQKEKKFKGKLKVIYSRHKGACIARNLAAKEAKGKYLSFLPADALLYPGVVRTWINHLESNPEFDFLYGGYRFVNEEKKPVMNYMSEPFDEYHLKTQNYIDGSFPLKRELFEKMGGWDPTIKSLQDWDFWLNAVINHKAKGFYLPEIFFETTIPHEGGLSDDSNKNWIERTEQIKNKYNIVTPAICVASKGAEQHGKKVAKILGADYKFSPEFKPHNYDLIYLLGLYPNIADQCGAVFARHRGLRVVHWIGSDILQLQQMSTHHKNLLLNWVKNNVDVNLTEFKTTQEELEKEGLKTRILPIPPDEFYDITPLPKDFTVAVYLPYQNKGFYRPELIEEVAKKCRDIKFKAYGDFSQTGEKGNITYLGKLDKKEMKKMIESSSCLLRIVPHDGLSISIEEFFTAGRRVVTNINNIEGAFEVYPELEFIVKKLNEVKKFIVPDVKNAKYWRDKLDHEKFKKFFEKLLDYNPKKYWEMRARSWDAIQENCVFDEKDVLEEIKKLNPKSILDIGCGNGNWAKFINNEIKVDYLGIDISDRMISYAKKRNPKLKFKQMDVREAGKLKNKFDLIFAYTCFLHIPSEDMKKTVSELKKVSKKILFVEPIKQGEVTGVNRFLHPEALKEYENGNIIMHPRAIKIHKYEEYFENIVKRKNLDSRELFIAEL